MLDFLFIHYINFWFKCVGGVCVDVEFRCVSAERLRLQRNQVPQSHQRLHDPGRRLHGRRRNRRWGTLEHPKETKQQFKCRDNSLVSSPPWHHLEEEGGGLKVSCSHNPKKKTFSSFQVTASTEPPLQMKTSNWSIWAPAGWAHACFRIEDALIYQRVTSRLLVSRWVWPTPVPTPTGRSSSSWPPERRGWTGNTWFLAKSWTGWWVNLLRDGRKIN